MMNKLNYLLVCCVIFLASCATNEDSLNKVSVDRAQEVGIDLTDFQAQFPNEFDLLDFDALGTTELEVLDGDVSRTAPMTTIPVMDNETILGYVGEFEGVAFYSIVEEDKIINTDLATGYTMSFPASTVKGELVADVNQFTPVNFVMSDQNTAEKGLCEWACAAAGIACVAACTAVVVTGTVVIVGGTGGVGAPVAVGAVTVQAACVAACLAAEQACILNC